ncbi:hypothetical protein LTR56_009236 [Elasticomyces elasticus]|nr:hypothetical protein LTR56_009236 [Elasticomyces elasticus]KAK3664768.1 hypothetical protein LTR22_004356 [Elasticomyces elasticus]KAK4928578.1 hypothetical protein LTR49_004699 [Elasticomyces elasticus]KAK5765146.1 hypothetical protein LTS12_004658 [Elasticomyces elasticus]
MATRRSTRLKGVKLSDDVTTLAAQARHQILASNRTALEAKYVDVRCKFNIFDLAPELRERIFYYAMEVEEPRQIATLKLPTLALVSKQIRAEVLPIFSGKCHFSLDLMGMSPSSARPVYGGLRPQTPAEQSYPRSGRIMAFDSNVPNSRGLLSRLKKRDNFSPCFRNVEFRIRGSHIHMRDLWTETRFDGIIRLELRASRPPTIESAVASTASVYQAELDMLQERAVTKAREIAGSRERFVGFTLQDLEEVIAEFAYWPV